MRWELNREVEIRFNHPVDASSISFSSILLRPISREVQGRPVTGVFTFQEGSDDKVVVFHPKCPTNEELDNGGFVPGGFRYQLTLPTERGFGQSVLRDKSGHRLSFGLTVDFRTPLPPIEPLFLDPVVGPPRILSVSWPEGLNLFSKPDPSIEVLFNQPVDSRPSNLNLDSLFLLYSDGAEGEPGEDSFPETNRLPGSLLLLDNCNSSGSGARILFQVTGILPPARRLRLVMKNSFSDLVGERNTSDQIWPEDHRTPRLSDIYQDPSWNDEEETVDEFRETFDGTGNLDISAQTALPPARLEDGDVRASFDFPGAFVSESADFEVDSPIFLEINTTGSKTVSDSSGRIFTVVNGVLQVHDLFIQSGAGLRARGLNALVIYATGKVTINGTLNVSGDNSHHPVGLNSPQFPEGGAKGECGGGDGGSASLVTNAETLRGENGDGPFGFEGIGGEGGEGGFQQSDLGNADGQSVFISGGGGGGTFGRTPSDAVRWTRWTGEERPTWDDRGPDHHPEQHPMYTRDSPFWPHGGEDGLRGSAWGAGNWLTNPRQVHGVHGMEDRSHDFDPVSGLPDDRVTGFDPPWTSGSVPPFVFGDPTQGADGGRAGKSIFSDDQDTSDDFWGRRLNSDGSVTIGELLTPWAGSGGGASGDSQVIRRQDVDGDGTKDPVEFAWPDPNFPKGRTTTYHKGAPGGGGGGQLVVMAIGPIVIGRTGKVLANGGIGHGGEASLFQQDLVSGSGGGSGGHIILHSATLLDLSHILLKDADGEFVVFADSAELVDYAENHFPDQPQPIQARGGRRGWSANLVGDGNGDFMAGRGGAGGNGVIQVHVPDPARNILWPVDNAAVIQDYIFHGDLGGNPGDIDRVEEVLDIFSVPKAYCLIPFFSAGSQVQSRWIDTGLAGLRDPAGGDGPFPDYGDPLLRFLGTDDGDGNVKSTNERVDRLAPVATGSTDSVAIDGFQMTVPGASSLFPAHLLRNPDLLKGYDILPSSTGARSFEIVAAEFDRAADSMKLFSLPGDGPMTFGLEASNPVWAVIPKFFRVGTLRLKDRLPESASVQFEFQATKETFPGSNFPDPASVIPGPVEWTADPGLLKGSRFFRYRITFDIDAQGAGVSLANERPAVFYVKIPFVW